MVFAGTPGTLLQQAVRRVHRSSACIARPLRLFSVSATEHRLRGDRKTPQDVLSISLIIGLFPCEEE